MGENLEDLMSAIAFAEAGEQETARSLLKGKRAVLLAVSDRLFDEGMTPLRYAIDICKRVEAALDILYVADPGGVRSKLKEFVSEAKKAGFDYSLIVRKDCMKKAIIDYTAKRAEILFVIVGSQPELDLGCEGPQSVADRSLSSAWKKLKCPLVVVSKPEAPQAA